MNEINDLSGDDKRTQHTQPLAAPQHFSFSQKGWTSEAPFVTLRLRKGTLSASDSRRNARRAKSDLLPVRFMRRFERAQPIYKVFMGRFLEAWYQLSKEAKSSRSQA